jgi:hypothetical protein
LILEAYSIDEVLNEVIANHIHSAFYASPMKYFQYIEETLSISIPRDQKATYSEIKATRDIYVHNGGVANKLYLQKAGKLARAENGDLLPLDEHYFASAISCMKNIILSVYRGLLDKYGRSRQLSTHQRVAVRPSLRSGR